jgi:transposase
MDFINKQIKELEKHILADLPDQDAYNNLMTVPGVGPVLARCILLETGPVTRFASAGHYASYCRAVPTEHTSNGKKKDEGEGKCGNPHLAWAFVEAAHFAARYCPEINAWFQRKLARTPKLRALPVKALANKLAKACYFILRENKPFDLARLLGSNRKQ